MKKQTNKEKILIVLQNKYKSSSEGKFYVYRTDFESLAIDEQEITRILFELQNEDALSITKKSPQKDLSIPWTIYLKSGGIHYFENNKTKKRNNRRDWVKTYVPITISTIALIKSFWPEIISIVKLIVQALK